jgi:choline-sulfatase
VAVTPTNVLFICSDEHSPRVLGCYGNPVVRTPNLDALAARGVRFEKAYCQTPICVPSRASLATGRYAHRIDSWDNASPYVGSEAASWGARLTSQGHKVTTIGKLHYRAVGDPSGFPDQRLPMHVLDGVGDLYGLLRADMPVRPQSRRAVLAAGPGEAEYTRYDRYYDLYPPDSVPLPMQHRPEQWPRHPALVAKRRQQALDEPLDERTIRTAIAAYYGMVTFLDEQIGLVLAALRDAGLAESTRILYTSDHGEMLGEKGLWWKSVMYEPSVSVPLIVAGPDVPQGRVSKTNAMLVDCFPSIVEAVGAELAPEDRDLPGESLWELARAEDRDRAAFSEYHAIFSSSATYALRHRQYKYVHYIGYPPQLFDLAADPDETRDLAGDPAHADALAECERALRSICDPEAVDRRARAEQRRKIDAAGGAAAVKAGGVKIPYTPAPTAFAPAPVEARDGVQGAGSQ